MTITNERTRRDAHVEWVESKRFAIWLHRTVCSCGYKGCWLRDVERCRPCGRRRAA